VPSRATSSAYDRGERATLSPNKGAPGEFTVEPTEYITIIATAGSDPICGFPGVSRTSRVTQPHVRVGRHVLASIMVNPSLLITRSTRMSRGWTYQEALYSQRRLIFTDQLLYYECSGANWSETCDLERSWPDCNIFAPRPLGKYPWEVIEYISAYTHRQLAVRYLRLRRFERDARHSLAT